MLHVSNAKRGQKYTVQNAKKYNGRQYNSLWLQVSGGQPATNTHTHKHTHSHTHSLTHTLAHTYTYPISKVI